MPFALLLIAYHTYREGKNRWRKAGHAVLIHECQYTPGGYGENSGGTGVGVVFSGDAAEAGARLARKGTSAGSQEARENHEAGVSGRFCAANASVSREAFEGDSHAIRITAPPTSPQAKSAIRREETSGRLKGVPEKGVCSRCAVSSCRAWTVAVNAAARQPPPTRSREQLVI